MTWHVIMLSPGALRPDRFRPNETIVSRSLKEGGFSYYMPFERRAIIHAKTKKRIERQFPLMPGYGFVENVTNFEALRKCNGVNDVIKSAGKPIEIRPALVGEVRDAEQAINAEYDRKEIARQKREAMGSRALVAESFPVGGKVTIGEGHIMAGQTMTITAATGRGAIKGVIDMLNGIHAEIGVEYLNAAE